MKSGKILCLLGAGFFLIYGFLFAIFPTQFSEFVTGGIHSTSSSLIDMRATYGGMSIAIGLVLIILAIKIETLRTAVVCFLLLMTCMASTRSIGMFIDGSPNVVMYIYLFVELVVVALCLNWLRFPRNEKIISS
ncbi:MAG: hypothetical protein ACI9CE_000594 [Flavobacterium sp.]|jgi:hypothetical protein